MPKEKEIRFIVHNLTRDKFAEQLRSNGIEVESRKLSQEEYYRRIKDKLLEDIQSIVLSEGSNNFLDIISDCLEELFIIAAQKGYSPSDSEQKRLQKLSEEGGFNNREYNYLIKMTPSNYLARYYRQHPQDYTEVDKNYKVIRVNTELLDLIGEKDTQELRRRESRWEIYHRFEEVVYKGSDAEIKKNLHQFTNEDFLTMPIINDLIVYKKLKFLKTLHKKNVPFTYTEWNGGNVLHTACGASGNLECVKFLIENNIITDIHTEGGRFGETPYILALAYNHQDIVEYLEEKFYIKYLKLKEVKAFLEIQKMNEWYGRKF